MSSDEHPRSSSRQRQQRTDGADPLRDQARRRRARPLPGTGDGRHAGRRASAGRGRAGPGQDAHREDAGRHGARQVQAHPVHARPGAGRPGGHPHLQPEDRRLQHLARPGLRQPAPGRRNQPRPRQGAERAARGDAGAPGHHCRRNAQGAAPLPGDGHPEPDRDRGHLPAARGAGGPLHDEGAGRLPERRGGIRHRRAGDRPAGHGQRHRHH